MASTTPSPVSHIPGPININYDSDDDMQVDSENDHPNANIKEPDPDADGESVDDDASPPPSTINIAGPSLSHRLGNSVCLYIIFHIFASSTSGAATGPRRLGVPDMLAKFLYLLNFVFRVMMTMETTTTTTIMTMTMARTLMRSTERRRLQKRKSGHYHLLPLGSKVCIMYCARCHLPHCCLISACSPHVIFGLRFGLWIPVS
jgi:hypothetical protein